MHSYSERMDWIRKRQWRTEMTSGSSYKTWDLEFISSYFGRYYYGRFVAQSVRPVQVFAE